MLHATYIPHEDVQQSKHTAILIWRMDLYNISQKVPIFFKRTLTQVVVVVRRQVEAVDLGEAAAAAAAQTCLLYQPTQR